MEERRTLYFVGGGGEKERNFVRRTPGFGLKNPDKRIVKTLG
jgi:hypothetical protein